MSVRIRWSLEICHQKLAEYKEEKEKIRREIMERTGWRGARSNAPDEYNEAVVGVNALIHGATNALYLRTPGNSRNVVGPRRKGKGLVSRKIIVNNRNRLIKKRELIKEEMKVKYNWSGWRNVAPSEYADRTWQITRRISAYNAKIREIDAKQDKIDNLAKRVEEFTSQLLKTEVVRRKSPYPIHGLYFKYGMEHGMKGTELCTHLGTTASNQSLPTLVRTNFTKSFSTNPENRELYHRFIQYMQSFE
jgi:hypothetical protein